MESSNILNKNENDQASQSSMKYLLSLNTATPATVSLKVCELNTNDLSTISDNILPVKDSMNTNAAQISCSSTVDKGTLFTSQSLGPQINITQSVVSDSIIGENSMTTTVMNKQGPSIIAPTILNGSFQNMPRLIRHSDSSPLILRNLSSKTLKSCVCGATQLEDIEKFGLYELQSKSLGESSTKTSVTSIGSELSYRVPLPSSDTIILDPEFMSTSKTSLISNHSILDKIMASGKSSASTASLLTKMSNRSVSLESIPSIGLFQPDYRSITNSLCKLDSMEISDSSKDGPETIVSDNTNSETSDAITIVGSNNIPPSIILLVKHHLNHTSPSSEKQISLITPSDQNDLKCSLLQNTADEGMDDQSYNLSMTSKRQISIEDENQSSTDTEMNPEEVPLGNHKHSADLSRSDTVILNVIKDSSVVCPDPKLHGSDTIILPCDDEKKANSESKLSEGFSWASTNSSLLPSLDVLLSEPSINKHMPIEVTDNLLLNQSLIQFPVSSFENGHVNKSLYVMTSEGHLAAVRYTSPDQVDVMQLNQPRFLIDTDVFRQILPPSSSNASSRSVEAKETQTDLVFGTNTLYFKLVDTVNDETVYSVGHLGSTILTKSQLGQQSSVPSTVVLSNSTVPAGQSQSSLEKFEMTLISLTEPAANEKVISCGIQTVSQETECSITSLETSKPGLPNTSTGDNCDTNKCIESTEKCKTKPDLAMHEKNYKSGFKCGLCNATFTRVGNFNRHRKIHNLQPENQNAFKCNDCGREFLQRCDLKRHLLIHTKQEPHRCDQCGKGYIRHSDLVVHMRFHNKDKAFKCTMCEKKFFQKGDLSRHIRNAHIPSSQLICGHCNRKYACESTLIRHMKAVHKDIILHTINKKIQESDSNSNCSSVNTKDVVFTMTTSPGRKY